MKILGIETSCDETGAAIIEGNEKTQDIKILGESLVSQINIHQKTKGVVPEVAARAHVGAMQEVLQDVLRKTEMKLEDIDAIAVTEGPGLIPALLVGTVSAKGLGFALGKPLIGVQHVRAHIYAALMNQKIEFPALALVVSGGHTQLVLMKGYGDFELIGQTRDDAAGEAFDKVAKLLDLGYPGGPIISELAEQGDSERYDLPRPMLNSGDLDFSFSGLKTAVRTLVHKEEVDKKDLAASFQQAVVDVLIEKTLKAIEQHDVKTVILAGGVSANKELRKQFQERIKRNVLIPDLKYCTDNAAMVAVAGFYEKNLKTWEEIGADSNKKF